MKKLVVIAVMVAMILGLMSVTSVSAEGPPSPPAPFATEDAVLVTVCEDLELEYDQRLPTVPIDAKGYTKFKLYAYMTPISVNATFMRIYLHECATVDPEKGMYLSRSPNPNEDWISWPMSMIPHYSMVIPIEEGIYSVFRIGAWYHKMGPQPSTPQPSANISIYLLMSK